MSASKVWLCAPPKYIFFLTTLGFGCFHMESSQIILINFIVFKITYKVRAVAQSHPTITKVSNFILHKVHSHYFLFISSNQIVLSCNVPDNCIALSQLDIPIYIIRKL